MRHSIYCQVQSGFACSCGADEQDAADAARWRWLVSQHNVSGDLPIAQVVWKRGNDPKGEWVNLIDGHDLNAHVDHVTGAPGVDASAEPCRYADQCNEEGTCANGCEDRAGGQHG